MLDQKIYKPHVWKWNTKTFPELRGHLIDFQDLKIHKFLPGAVPFRDPNYLTFEEALHELCGL